MLIASTSRAQTQLPCTTIQDPIGDAEIQNATGTFAINTARADLIGASFQPEGGGYVASVSTSQPFLLRDKEKGNIVFMFDVDAITENNSEVYEDVRGGADLHYLVGPNTKDPSQFVVRRYVFSALGTWQQTRTSSTVDVSDEDISIHIPKEELALADPTRWRAWISLGISGEWTVRDGAPTRSSFAGECGYLPVPDLENMSALPEGFKPSSDSITDIRPGLIALGIYLLLAGVLTGMKRFRS